MSANDFALLTKWTTERDPEAFRELASRYAAMVYATCHRILGNATEAEDVAQECFVALSSKGGAAKSNLPAWLHKVATTRAIDHVKKDKRRKAREQRFAETQPAQVEPEWRDIQPLVDEAIAGLREEYRVAVVAHFLDGQSHAEVAEALGVSRQTVTYRVGKGVEGIRTALKKKGIAISASALTAMFGANLAEAAPASLMAALGKMALSGSAGTAAAGAGASALAGLTVATKAALALGAAAIAVLALFVAKSVTEPTSSPRDTPQEQQDIVTADQATTSAASNSDPQDGEAAAGGDAVNPAAAPVTIAGKSDWRVLTGVVVDENGDPVTWSREDADMRRCEVLCRSLSPRNQSVGRYVAEDGSFRIERFDPGAQGIAWARLLREDLISASAEFALTEDGPHDLVLKLRPGASISGTFVDAVGRPFTGTKVRATWQDPRFGAESNIDDQGRFSLGPLLAGEYELSVSGEEKYNYNDTPFSSVGAMVRLNQGQQRTGVRLQFEKRQETITGRVTNQAGQPVEGASVSARGPIGSDAEAYAGAISSVTTDAGGRFELPVFGPGEYDVRAGKENYESVTMPAVAAGCRDVGIALQARARIERVEGRVVRSDTGEPIPTFRMALMPADYPEGALDGRHFDTVKDENGEFRCGHSGNGDLVLTIRVPGLGETEHLIRRSDPACVTTGLVIRVAPGEVLAGVVVDEAGAPVADARILSTMPRWLDSRELDENLLAKSGPDGRFNVVGLNPQTTSICVYHDALQPVEAPVMRGGDWRIVMPVGATIEGTVLVGGEPKSGIGVELETIPHAEAGSSRLRKSTKTDSNGVFRFTGVPAGEVKLAANAVAGVTAGMAQYTVTKTAMAVDGMVTTVDFEFEEPNASLLAKVFVGGEPGRGRATVRRMAEGATAFGGGDVIKPDGSIRMKRLVPGPVELKVTLDGPCRREKRIPLELRANQTAETEVRFVPGDAGLEGLVAVGATPPSRLRLLLEVQTASGLERISIDGLRMGDDGVFSLSGLPAGTATLRVEFTTQSAGHRTCDYTLNLEPGMVARQDVVLGGGGVVLDVVGGATGQRLWAMVYEGALDLPDFASMTINEIERFNREIPPVLTTDKVSGGFDGLDTGTHTVVVIAPGGEIHGEDHVLPGLRYGAATVDVQEDANVTASVTLR